MPSEGRLATAHYGYVYAMELIQRKDEVWLVSGSGDSDVKVGRLGSTLTTDLALP